MTDKQTYIRTCIHAYIQVIDSSGKPLSQGDARDSNGQIKKCVTMVLVVPPMHIMDACYIEVIVCTYA